MSEATFYPLTGDQWALTCDHGTVTSIEVARMFTQDLIVGCFAYWARHLPAEATVAVVGLVAIRVLLGRLGEIRFGCSCGLQAFVVASLLGESDQGRLQ